MGNVCCSENTIVGDIDNQLTNYIEIKEKSKYQHLKSVQSFQHQQNIHIQALKANFRESNGGKINKLENSAKKEYHDRHNNKCNILAVQEKNIMGSLSTTVQMLIEASDTTLNELTKSKFIENQPFTQQEFMTIFSEMVLILNNFLVQHLSHQNVRLDYMFQCFKNVFHYDSQTRIHNQLNYFVKLMDPVYFGNQTNLSKLLDHGLFHNNIYKELIYLSPEEVDAYNRKSTNDSNPYSSDVFTLGMCMLHLLTEQDMSDCYLYTKDKIQLLHDKLENRMYRFLSSTEFTKGQQIMDILNDMLQMDVKTRINITSILKRLQDEFPEYFQRGVTSRHVIIDDDHIDQHQHGREGGKKAGHHEQHHLDPHVISPKNNNNSYLVASPGQSNKGSFYKSQDNYQPGMYQKNRQNFASGPGGGRIYKIGDYTYQLDQSRTHVDYLDQQSQQYNQNHQNQNRHDNNNNSNLYPNNNVNLYNSDLQNGGADLRPSHFNNQNQNTYDQQRISNNPNYNQFDQQNHDPYNQKINIKNQYDPANVNVDMQTTQQQNTGQQYTHDTTEIQDIFTINYQHENGNSKYEGQMLNNQRHGQGMFVYPQGGYYQGNWVYDIMEGQGTLYAEDGRPYYEGEFRASKFHGKGTIYQIEEMHGYASVDYQDLNNNLWLRYVGDFNQDMKEGKGTYFYENQMEFKGEFTHDKPNGHGIFFNPQTGERIEGVWRNGYYQH